MQVIIKPGGILALILAIGALIGIVIFASQKGTTPVPVANPSAPAVPATASSADPVRAGDTVPAAFVFPAGNGNPTVVTGQLINGATSQKLEHGVSMTFDSRGQQFTDLGKAYVDTTKSFSVSAWVRINDPAGYQTFVSQDGDSISGFYLQHRDDSRQLSFTMNGSDATPPINPGLPDATKGYQAHAAFTTETGKWYHLVGSYDDSTHKTKLYVNNKLEQTTTIPSEVQLWQAKGHTLIGAAHWDHKRIDFTNGTVENVRLYPRVLSATDVAYLYKNHL